MKLLASVPLCLMLTAAPVCSSIRVPAAPGVGTYSNLVGTDDIEGVELRVMESGGQYRAMGMYAEGGCGTVFHGILKIDGTRWLFEPSPDQALQDYGTIRFWVQAEGRNLRLFASDETDWIARTPNGDLLHRARRNMCLH